MNAQNHRHEVILKRYTTKAKCKEKPVLFQYFNMEKDKSSGGKQQFYW